MTALPQTRELNRLALYIRPSCPYCLRVLDACHALGISLPTNNIAEGAHLEALMVGGGKRQVPCLQVRDEAGDAHWLYESQDIIAYLKTQFG